MHVRLSMAPVRVLFSPLLPTLPLLGHRTIRRGGGPAVGGRVLGPPSPTSPPSSLLPQATWSRAPYSDSSTSFPCCVPPAGHRTLCRGGGPAVGGRARGKEPHVPPLHLPGAHPTFGILPCRLAGKNPMYRHCQSCPPYLK